MLDEVSLDPRCFVIRGEPLEGINRDRCRRLLYTREDGAPPTFREVPRRWVIIDFDDPPGPYRFDPRDGALAGSYCRSLLPLSGDAAPSGGRCRRPPASRPACGSSSRSGSTVPASWRELERILAGCPIDVSTLRPVQPIFVGAADPGRRRRSDPRAQRARGGHPRRRAPAGAGRGSGAGRAGHPLACRPSLRERRQPEHGRTAPRRALPRNRARQRRRPASVPDLGGGARGRTRRRDPARADRHAELIAAARRAGLQDSDNELQRQVRNGFRLGIFGAEAAA